MKQYISRLLKSVALFYLTFPVSYLFVVALLFDIPANQCLRILLTPSYYAISAVAMFVGYGLWEMKRWAWYLFIASHIVLMYLNAVALHEFSESHHKLLAFLASIAAQIVLVYRVSREIRVPYFFPKIRWWESNPRYKLASTVQLSRISGPALAGEILDISIGGCFVKVRQDLLLDEPLSLDFAVFGRPVTCRGIVVWRTQSTVTHPRGIGVKFSGLDRPAKRTLRVITKRLKRIAQFYRRSRYLLNQEDFLKRLKELEGTGK